ncbi:lasso peptide biosynthesis B2 protein [Mycetocola sp. BIGb0189]|uniref:lasso peptide biosynthesis B2 protein n=1 Tax=Mycetocola sp. BIGb0189 TaxID=2940604 RepID=UPI0037C8880F
MDLSTVNDHIEMVVPRPHFAGGFIRRLQVWACISAAHILARLSVPKIEWVLHSLAARARPAIVEAVGPRRVEIEALSASCSGEGCLKRSLAIFLLSFHDDHTVPTWKSGVQIEPFRAHAWVECAQVAVGEPSDFNSDEFLIAISIGVQND